MSDDDAPTNNLTRVTVNLTPKAVRCMAELSLQTGFGKTDTINRALQIYALVAGLLDERGALTVVRPDGASERIYIL